MLNVEVILQACHTATRHREACATNPSDDRDRMEESGCSTVTWMDTLYGSCSWLVESHRLPLHVQTVHYTRTVPFRYFISQTFSESSPHPPDFVLVVNWNLCIIWNILGT